MQPERPNSGDPAPLNEAAPSLPTRPRVFILSDIRLLREGITLALSQQGTIQVVGSSDLSLPVRQMERFAPHVIILDVTEPTTLDMSTALHNALPEAKIVVFGAAESERVVMACARAGVSGFVYPQGSAHDVVMAIHSAIRGELMCSPRTASMLLNRINVMISAPARSAWNDALTPREQEITSLMSEGLSNKQIARVLGICDATVKNHIHSILSKLGVRRRGEAAAQLHRTGSRDLPRTKVDHAGNSQNRAWSQTKRSIPSDPSMADSRRAERHG